MKTLVSLSLLLVLTACASKKSTGSAPVNTVAQGKVGAPVVAFEVTEGIMHPESVLYSKEHNSIFVSNIFSGNPQEKKRVSYISKLSAEGKVIKSKWVKGLKAPKGMAIVKNYLYVSDVDQLVRINIKRGTVSKTFKVPNGKFINDVVADKEGNIYLSDMFDNCIYKLGKDGLKVWIKSDKLTSPNGLFTDGQKHMIVGLWGDKVDAKTFVAEIPGGVVAIDLANPKDDFNVEPSVRGHMDGIDSDKDGNLWLSDWVNGNVFLMKKNGQGELKYNFGQGTADISVAKELGLLLVPQMYQNKIIAVKL